MLLKRFYDDGLAHASWLVGCAATGEALVVDPNRDLDVYVAAAEAERLRITHVAETHIHADFLSGARALAERTGAVLHLSDEGGEAWRYAFARADKDVLLCDGDTFMVGNIRIEARHTPGHTPEHMVYVVTDTAGADAPMGVLTGDFVFVGDVGRPDLLERAAGHAGTMDGAARQLFHSLQAFRELPDYVQLWPAHGAGSACGKALGAVPQTTLGYEKLFNWAFQESDEAAFVRRVLAGQPEPPRYFERMKRENRDGPAPLDGMPVPPHLAAGGLDEVVAAGGMLLDTRGARAFERGHVPGAVNIPLSGSFPTYAGSVLPADGPIHLIVGQGGQATATRVARELALIGIDGVAGWFAPEALEAWAEEGRPLARLPEIDTEELRRRMAGNEVAVVDVRGRSEWAAGHLPGVPVLPLNTLLDHMDAVPTGRPLVVHCQSGVRSAIAASLLRAHGVEEVLTYRGSFAAWQAAGLPVERETRAEANSA